MNERPTEERLDVLWKLCHEYQDKVQHYRLRNMIAAWDYYVEKADAVLQVIIDIERNKVNDEAQA